MDITERLSKLTPEQRKLLELKLKQQKNSIDLLQIPITAENRESTNRFPLSFAQERLWFVDQLSPGNPAYNIVRATKLEGNLNIKALEKSIEHILHRHEVLRTTFIFEQDEPKQVIQSGLSIPMPLIDLKHLSKEQQEETVKEIKERESLFAFGLGKFPLIRTHLLELSPVEFVFLLVIHHIVSDGISAEIFLSELIRLYRSFSAGETPGLPDLPVQYVDYACWQRRWTDAEKYGEFWLNEFKGEIPVLEIPVDHPRPVMQSFEGDIVYFKLNAGTQKALKEIAAREKTTLFVLLLALYNIFLSKISGMEDIIVGSPVAGRRHRSVQEMIGIFINTLALRNFPAGDKRFIDFLGEVRARTLKAFENQEYRYEDIVDKVAIVRDTGRNPLFDVVFVMQNQEAAGLDITGLKLTPLPYQPRTSKFDLSFEVIVEGDNLRFSFEYCTALFKEETVRRYTNYFINVVSSIVQEPGIRIGEIDIIDEEEREHLLSLFNTPGVVYPEDKTIHQLFEEQVIKSPDHIALLESDRSYRSHLSYSLLNRDAGRLASLLRERGIVPGTIVAMLTERSFEMIIGILAVLKAGGGYLPIDPYTPRERVDYLLTDSGAKVLLTQSGPGSNNLQNINAPVVLNFEYSDFELRASDLSPSNLAYVIYTSGTTGRPKGVMIEHRNVVQLMFNNRFSFDFDHRDVWTLFHSYNFDFSVWEMYGALLYGGKLCIIPKLVARDADTFLKILREECVTVLNQTPSSFYHLSEEETTRPDLGLSLRYIIFGGEALAPGRLRKWRDKYPGVKLINMYGITETTVHVTYKEIGEREIVLDESNIGRPLPTLTVYVVNRFMKLVPVGVPGELLVGGAGVGRGYLNRPELTLSKFNRSNWSYRTYRTGDLAKITADGELVYLGRIDHQVKIRGFRIETGEIENRLRNHEAIKETVVVARQNESGEKFLCAYYVPVKRGEIVNVTELREFLSITLPDYMIPSYFIAMEAFPLTSNQKINRKALPDPDYVRPSVEAEFLTPQTDLERVVADQWKQVLKLDRIGIHDNFFELGGNSLNVIQLNRRLKDTLKRNIPVAVMFKYLTVSSFARYLMTEDHRTGESEFNEIDTNSNRRMDQNRDRDNLEIAVVGMSCRFPGAQNIREFWENLKNGVNSIRFFTEEELLQNSSMDHELIKNPDFVNAKGVIEKVEYFDAAFFGFSPLEAEVLDPQIRVFSEICWEALENAGCDPSTDEGPIGLYAGGTPNLSWEVLPLLGGGKNTGGRLALDILKDKDYLSTRISHRLDLNGPSITLYTACSTALVAIDIACRALLTGQCRAALAGGVSIQFEDARGGGYIYEEGMIQSPDGYCRAFDSKAKGTVFSNGAGVVLLKRMTDAAADGDHIYAIVKGSALNNDGIEKSSFTAPSVRGQADVIRNALAMGGIDPLTVTYVETHGTATEIGDPIEVEALKTAFNVKKNQYCAIGSVKTNIGHLDAAAGAAGFIKTVLMLKHRQIPPSLNYHSPNPAIDFEDSPFFVNTHLRKWETTGFPLRAGVSSFGVGGTNAHIVLEEAPPREAYPDGRSHHLILLSARTANALEESTHNFLNYLKTNRDIPGFNFADAAYTLKIGRKTFEQRRMFVCRDLEDAVKLLEAAGKNAQIPGSPEQIRTFSGKEKKRAVFMFPGQGSQYVDMARGLYESEPIFRDELDHCFTLLSPLVDFDIKEILYPGENRSDKSNGTNGSFSEQINLTGITQPVIFIIEYALAKLLIAWGISPYTMIGHSIGEYTAACLSGVFTLEDALEIVAWRGKLMQQMPAGSMLSVTLPEADLTPLLFGELALAAVNGQSLCVISGPDSAVDSFGHLLEEKGIQSRKLHTSHAFHSGMMDPVLKLFEEKVGRVTLHEPRIPFISNLTGKWISGREAVDPVYWARHLRGTVRFADGLSQLLQDRNALFIEVGPGRTLSTFVRNHPDILPEHKTVNLLRHPHEEFPDDFYLLSRIGQIWLYGKSIHWKGFYSGEKRHRISLPLYPFQRQYFWPKGNPINIIKEGMAGKALSSEKNPIDRWFYTPAWIPSPRSAGKDEEIHRNSGRKWLVFSGDSDFAAQLEGELMRREGKERVTVVRIGKEFSELEAGIYSIDPHQESHYGELIRALRNSSQETGGIPNAIVHLWNLGNEDEQDSVTRYEQLEKNLDLGFFSLIYFIRALSGQDKQDTSNELEIFVLTNGMQEVSDEGVLYPLKAAVMGPVLTIPWEYSNTKCCCIDIKLPDLLSGQGYPSNPKVERLVNRLMNEFRSGINRSEPLIAYRGNYRLKRTFEPYSMDSRIPQALPLRTKGVYLVTGGLGGIGFVLARHLAETLQAKLILTGRSFLPAGEEWEEWLNNHDDLDSTGKKIRQVKTLESLGAEVAVYSVDAADIEAMRKVVEDAQKRFGTINGVIHAAGTAGGGLIELKKHESIEKVLGPKIKGTLALEDALKSSQGTALDFFILCSSVSAVLSSFGQVDYCAANAFMDAFAYYKTAKDNVFTISIDWDTWKEVGMAVDSAKQYTRENDKLFESLNEEIDRRGISPSEGIEVFSRILSGELPHVVVSTIDLETRINEYRTSSLPGETNEVGKDAVSSSAHSRPDIGSPYAAPVTDMERSLAVIWQEILGINQVGVNDDFFELGGDSLRATLMIAKIKKEFKAAITVKQIFNSPSIKELSKELDISRDQEPAISHLHPVEKKEYYLLSSMQKRLYILEQMESIGTTYNLPYAWIMEEIDILRLEKAFTALIHRHESLRTSFGLVGEEPVQVIHNTGEMEFRIEFSDLNKYVGETGIEPLLNRFIRPFDLSRAPLMRVGLFRESEKTNILIIDVHHIVADGASFLILLRDFDALYKGKQLPELKSYYKDYSHWLQSETMKQVLQKQENYWLKVFSGEIPLLNLPADFSRPPVQAFEGGRMRFSIEEGDFRKIKKIASEENATLFMVLLGIFNVFLSRLAAQEDIIIGSPAAGREHPDVENIVGMFVNTLVFRNYPERHKTFRGFIKEVKTHSLEVYENQNYPFELLVENAPVKRDISRNPLFDVMFDLRNQDTPSMELGRFFEYDSGISKFDLTQIVVELKDRLECAFEYSTRLFKKETVARYTDYYKNSLSFLLENPDALISGFDILPQDEKERILFEFNDTESSYPHDKVIHEFFEMQAAATPGNIALVDTNRVLTYGELLEESGRMASLLRKKGVTPGSIVGILAHRSIGMMIGIFGILRAGGVYLPLAPEYPEDRINYILEDSAAKVLLVHSSLTRKMTVDREVILLEDNSRGGAEPLTTDSLPCTVCSEDLAYIIYTSGSTGKPKGVLIEHRSLVNRLNWMQKAYPIGKQDVILQKTTITFDVSVWELFWWSMVGASLCLLEPGGEKNPAVIIETIARRGVTTMHFVPSMLGVFLQYLDEVDTSMLRGLRRIFASGEALMPNHVEQFNRLLNQTYGTELINLYGPTEATIDVSYYNCNHSNEMAHRTTVPIGRPIDNTRLYILGKWDQLQGIGIPGELCIGGDGLARGYLNRPELTAEKFYRSDRTYITYRTGDLARWLSDGNIEFLGRIDHQVKIRGFRIEPGEIENSLLRHEAVKEALVMVCEDNKGEKSLCAYFVVQSFLAPDENSFSSDRLKEYLAAHLPDYMVPTFFVPLEKFPLTPNGKVDRKALPQPAAASVEGEYLAPGSPIEEKLVTVWQQVLGVERVGINDNFFQLGGDSIKAIQVAAGLRKYGLDMKIDDLFLYPVIKRLGGFINVIRRVIPQEPVEGEISLTPIQHWFFNSHPVHPNHFNQALIVYRETGFDETLLEKVFKAVVEHHDVLRSVVKGEGTSTVLYNRGTWEKSFELEMIRFEGTSGKDFQEYIETRAQKLQEGIDLEAGPLVKLGLFKTSEGDHLLIVIHHLVIDGVSWRILLEDLALGYEQAQKGEPIVFQAKTDSFQYWSRKLNEYALGTSSMDNKELFEELNYWKSIESRSVAPLSRDRKVPVDKKENRYNDVLTVQLDRDETENLLKRTNSAYNTEVNDILLTALGLAIKEWDGLEQVLINLEGHGREAVLEDADISRTVGWFTSLYPVLLDMSGLEEISDAVTRVKETLRGIPRRGIGYGILRYLVPVEKRQECRFQLQPEISFNYLGQFGREILETETFQFSSLRTGDTASPAAPPLYTFDINGVLIDGQLQISFTYNTLEYERESIEAFGRSYRSHLARIIYHCTATGGRRLGFTPSDFPLAVIDQSRLDRLVERYASKAKIEDIYALSSSQQSMIFHHLYSPDSSVTVEHEIFGIRSELDIGAFKMVWQTLTERHASLRASFHWQGLNEPVQVIHKNLEVPFEVMDLRDLPASKREEQFALFLETDRRRGFDLSEPPLMRVFVFKLEDSHFMVLWTYHHLLLDGWCRGILMREIVRLYDAYSRGKDNDTGLDSIPPFKNYIRWMTEQDVETAAQFWRNYLKGFTAPVLISKNLPYRSVPGETLPFGETRYEYSEEETRRFLELSKDLEITLNTLVQGAWALLLNHYSSEEDIVFGATGSGRPAQLDGALTMIGCFMNTVPMRVKVNPSTSVRQWLREIQLNHSRVRQYEHSSLADIRSCSEVPRASALYDLYETIVVFENYPFDFDREAGMLGSMSSTARLEEQMDYPLTLYIIPGARLSFKLLFDTRFFNKSTVEQLTAHLVYLLGTFFDCSECFIGDIPMVTWDEAFRITVNWNDTVMDYPYGKTVVHLFEERTAIVPDHMALVFGDIHLTYNELNQLANRLARGLKENGIHFGQFVALKMDRSVELVVGILGILKAGAAYLPIAPELPDDRISYMLKDSGAALLLTRDRLEFFCRGKETNPGIAIGPHDLVYIIYTSGTTGLPKGVMVEHRNIANLLTWFGRRYSLEDRRHVAQMSDYVFDPSVEQILGTLIFGSVVYMIPRELILDTDGFRRFVESRQIDMINFVPEALKELLLSGETSFSGLKTVISGGDRLDESIKDGILRRGYRLYNHYGPTEITVDALSSECSEERVHLGKPIANTRIYVLDRLSRLLPAGVPGELYIAGEGVTRGYLNAPELTAEKFNRSYRSKESNRTYTLFYHTGDLVRWLPGGNIEFLGRVDQQVKIRGLRVEPGETEAHLLAVEGIKEAVVLLKANEKGDKYLCAYFTSERTIGSTELKERLISKLPIYMVPSVFIRLERWPLNPNGKVDFRALPVPGALPVEDYVAPGNEIEEQLVPLWAEVLGLKADSISVESNFFDLGGQSLSAMKLVSSIREHLHTKLPLAAFFQVSTIKGIAAMIREDRDAGKEEKSPEDHSFAGVIFIKKKRIEREV